MKEAVVSGKSGALQLKERAYSVTALDAGRLQNANLNAGSMLKKVAGVNVRQEGGLGSNYSFSINGLSGKQVKFFMDGIPMDNYGSSYDINNIPVNLIKRLEVYKGVVPVGLGSDALGGAVNIVTREQMEDYLDASYSYGSFNTHKSALNARYTIPNTGILLQASAYYNYSDNDYRVDDLEKHDALGNVTGTRSARRFHDQYRAAMLQVKAGMVDKAIADKVMLGLTLSGNRNNVQHGMSLERVFGQVHTRDRILMPSLEYRKKDAFLTGLDLRAYASYIDGHYQVVDTSSREYNWDGSYDIRNNPNIGESDWQKSLFSFDDRTLLTVNHASYNLGPNRFNLNHTYTFFIRKGQDPFDPDIVPFSDPNHLYKNIFGLSYTRELFRKQFSITFLTKYFMYRGKTVEEDLYSENPSAIIHESRFQRPGFGFAGTWHFKGPWQLKASFENTYRLPDGPELFGDGLNVISNPVLRPEHSKNFNAGAIYSRHKGLHGFMLEGNYFYRDAENLIRLAAAGAKSEYVNLSMANIQGLESEFTYRWDNRLWLSLNATYQHMINKTRYDENGKPNHTYNDRIPNIPYLYGNFNLRYETDGQVIPFKDLSLSWHTRYVHEFYLQWPGHGAIKNIIPGQLLHHLEISYAHDGSKYNVSLGSTNLFDQKAYDNFRIQKPGRAVYVKLRYFI